MSNCYVSVILQQGEFLEINIQKDADVAADSKFHRVRIMTQTPLPGTHPFLPAAALIPRIAYPHPVPITPNFPPPPQVLQMDTTYKVLVTDYAGGPWNFSVQLQDDQRLLEGVTETLQRVEKVPIRAPHYPGKHCIAFHPIQKVYARATIAQELDCSAIIEFDDYGDRIIVSLKELFQFPPRGLGTHRLSQKFRLSGLSEIDTDCSAYYYLPLNFENAIRNKKLLLTVTKTEEGCAQNCDLYDMTSQINVKSLMNRWWKHFFVADKPPAVSTTLPVSISHVDSLVGNQQPAGSGQFSREPSGRSDDPGVAHDDQNSGGGLKHNDHGGGFQKKRQNKDNGGGGFQKKRQNKDNGGGFGDGGFRKNRRDNASGGGFSKFGGGNSGRPNGPMRQRIRNKDRAPAGSKWAEPSIDLNVQVDVLITYFFTPHDFYVNMTTDKDAFVTIMENMQTDYANKFSLRRNKPPQAADIVIGKFSEDKVLYRAEVTVSEPLTVRFVDYGNTDTISDGRDVYPVMSKLLDLPKQAVRCRLAGVSPIGDKWSDTSNYFDKEQIKCTFLSVQDGIYTVSLSCNGVNIARQLIAGGAAMVETTAQESLLLTGVEPSINGTSEPITNSQSKQIEVSRSKKTPSGKPGRSVADKSRPRNAKW